MSFESQPVESAESKIEHDPRSLRIVNDIQMKLMFLMCKPRDTKQEQNEEFVGWAEHYGPSFRVIMKEILARDEEFFDKWENDIFEQEKTLGFFESELKKLDGPSQAAA